MQQRYEPKKIEPKWQKIWDDTEVYKADLDSDKKKYIAMSMFNYPSGNLHIGHAMNYTIPDVLARFKRQHGYESYHPVGWDSFGLPAENRAIKEGMSPQQSMAQLIPDYHKAYKAMGWSNDWSKEISTHEPEYYKWTQWIFSEMYRAGLAYQEERQQWWCEIDNTVLANEQVIDGKCWRHDGPNDPEVKKRGVKQWFFKITDYADELLDAIDDLDWTESVKLAQRNWIGRSQGAEISFPILDSESSITVYTTAHETIFGTTFLVLAPEHEMLQQLTSDEQKKEVEAYVKAASLKSDVARQQEGKDKTGIFTGSYAINPINNEKIPIFVADYVLANYGSGAIMAVPGEDERDNQFAKKYKLPIIYTTNRGEFTDYGQEIKPARKSFIIANSGKYNGQNFKEARKNILADLVRDGKATAKTEYKMRDWSVSRQRYWGAPIPIVNCEKCGSVLIPDNQLPVVLPELTDFQPAGDGRSALARAEDWVKTTCPECGGEAERETDTLDTYICSSWYMLRYLDPHDSKHAFTENRADKWMPIDFYNGADHATAHLLYARFVTRFFYKKGLVPDPEPFKRFLFNGKITASDGTMFSKSKGNGIDPLEIINSGYGADALRTYLMFAAPLEIWAKWNANGVPGAYRYLNRVWDMVQEIIDTDEINSDNPKPELETELMSYVNKTIKKVTQDLERLSYNTAIAKLMELNKNMRDVAGRLPFAEAKQTWIEAIEKNILLLAPFAPFMAEELWHQLGHDRSVHISKWPEWDEKLVSDELITVVIQVNGKLRANLEVSADSSEQEIIELAKADEKVQKHIKDQDIKKTIYVKGKIVNFVV